MSVQVFASAGLRHKKFMSQIAGRISPVKIGGFHQRIFSNARFNAGSVCRDAESSGDESAAADMSMFFVEKDAPGLSFGDHEDKMGIRTSGTCDVVFEDCRIPVSAVIGEEGTGFETAMSMSKKYQRMLLKRNLKWKTAFR